MSPRKKKTFLKDNFQKNLLSNLTFRLSLLFRLNTYIQDPFTARDVIARAQHQTDLSSNLCSSTYLLGNHELVTWSLCICFLIHRMEVRAEPVLLKSWKDNMGYSLESMLSSVAIILGHPLKDSQWMFCGFERFFSVSMVFNQPGGSLQFLRQSLGDFPVWKNETCGALDPPHHLLLELCMLVQRKG